MLRYSKFCIFYITFCLVSGICGQSGNNVCKTFEDYYDNMIDNPNCSFNPELDASPEEIAKLNGVELERHKVRTDDGYILTTFRLKSINGPYGKDVIFIQHGLGTDSMCFMINGNRSLAFFLVKQGYDVWLGNYRNSQFCSHISLPRDNPKYWDFSFHEIGLYDLSAYSRYIRDKTKKLITYIGHSMGGTGFGVYATMKAKEAATYIKNAILIAPGFYMRHNKGLTSKENLDIAEDLLTAVTRLNLHVLFATNSYDKQLLKQTLFSSLENGRMCMEIVDQLSGKSPNPMNMERLPLAFSAIRDLILKAVFHYFQFVRSGEFRMFDYGPVQNKLRYNSTVPPSYNISAISIPITLIYADEDHLAAKEDIIYLYETFKKPSWDIYGIPYDHMAFLVDNNVEKYLFPILQKSLRKYVK